jgi:hypothetical protein
MELLLNTYSHNGVLPLTLLHVTAALLRDLHLFLMTSYEDENAGKNGT